jgi:bacillithiol biosynthesis cysteine-adding enzyme BshC
VTLKIVPTPITAAMPVPPPRSGGFAPALRAALVPSPGVDAAIEKLARPDVLVVTTGQQPGFLTGPLYTIHKALSAAALARALELRWRMPVVPLFWVAGDDHDFAEGSHASWIAANGELVTVHLRERAADAPLVPLYREFLGTDVSRTLEAFAASLPPAPARDAALDWLSRHYRPEQSLASAFQEALAELLAPFGIVCLDSTHPALKGRAAPRLVEALRRSAELGAALGARDEALRAAGHDPGVAPGDGATLVMVEGRLGRDRLVRDGQGFVTRRGGERFSMAELEAIAAAEPTRLSPNVLLRPVIESALLPTVAYAGGPGELRYLPLAEPLYEALGVHRQIPVARWSGMLVEPRVERALEKFGASLDELLAPGTAIEARLARSQLPSSALDALAELRQAIGRSYGALGESAVTIDPTLERTVQGARQQSLSAAADLEKKLLHHLKKRAESELAQVARARTALLPAGKPQERVLGAPGFLARYGREFLGELDAAIGGWAASALEAASPAP